MGRSHVGPGVQRVSQDEPYRSYLMGAVMVGDTGKKCHTPLFIDQGNLLPMGCAISDTFSRRSGAVTAKHTDIVKVSGWGEGTGVIVSSLNYNSECPAKPGLYSDVDKIPILILSDKGVHLLKGYMVARCPHRFKVDSYDVTLGLDIDKGPTQDFNHAVNGQADTIASCTVAMGHNVLVELACG